VVTFVAVIVGDIVRRQDLLDGGAASTGDWMLVDVAALLLPTFFGKSSRFDRSRWILVWVVLIASVVLHVVGSSAHGGSAVQPHHGPISVSRSNVGWQ
jgi:hypothetical protein